MKTLSSRKQTLCNDLLFVDGLAGSGKTMLSPILASLKRVELMTYAFEVQFYCNLHYTKEISLNSASLLTKLYIDLKLYNSMMGREMNFRPSDLSSALRSPTPEKYLARLFAKGDEVIPQSIEEQKPIMNFLVHNLLPFAEPIKEAFGQKAKFIDVVRHPLYMIKQQALNMANLVGGVRDIDIYVSYKEKEVPFWTLGWEELFFSSSPFEKAIHYMNFFMKKFDEDPASLNPFRICFEKFVLTPELYYKDLLKYIGTEESELTAKIITDSNIPREKVTQGVDIDIYRRCGWEPGDKNLSERGELDLRYEMVKKEVSPEALKVLDSLINNYEKKFWKPEI